MTGGHLYIDGRWICTTCDTSCAEDNLPCDCCFDQIAAVVISDGKRTESVSDVEQWVRDHGVKE